MAELEVIRAAPRGCRVVHGGVAEAGGRAGCRPNPCDYFTRPPWGCQDGFFSHGRAFVFFHAVCSTPVKHENRLGALICLVCFVYLGGLD